MQDRPTAGELLEAIEEFLRDHSTKERDRLLRFQFLVAANSLAILRREWEQEEPCLEREWDGLNALLGAEERPRMFQALRDAIAARNDRLCDRIAEGQFDDAEPEAALLDHFQRTVTDKVRIASPNQLA
jgi:hypothetical protein